LIENEGKHNQGGKAGKKIADSQKEDKNRKKSKKQKKEIGRSSRQKWGKEQK